MVRYELWPSAALQIYNLQLHVYTWYFTGVGSIKLPQTMRLLTHYYYLTIMQVSFQQTVALIEYIV